MWLVASARSRTDRNAAGSGFAPTRRQSLRSPFGPSSSGGMRTRPRVPNVRASAIARSVASRSSATYTRLVLRNSGSHAGCQPPVPHRPHAPVSLSPATGADSVSGIPCRESRTDAPASPALYRYPDRARPVEVDASTADATCDHEERDPAAHQQREDGERGPRSTSARGRRLCQSIMLCCV